MAYDVIKQDLSAELSSKEIISRNVPFTYVIVLDAPADVDLQLSIGDGPAIPFVAGQAWHGDRCNPEINGLYLSCSAQQGVTVTIYVAKDGIVSQGR